MFRMEVIGRLGRDPVLRKTSTGRSVCNYSVAVDVYRGKDRGNEVTWIDVTTWGKQAENDAKFLSKGREVYLRGEPGSRSYVPKSGDRVHVVTLTPELGGVQYLGSGSDSQAGSAPSPQEQEESEELFSDDEVPF